VIDVCTSAGVIIVIIAISYRRNFANI